MDHTFVFTADETLESVSVAGTFNNWDKAATPLSLDPDGSTWRLVMQLEPGQYAYKFVLNGETWVTDPQPKTDETDADGNSLLNLDEPVFPTPENPMDGPLTTSEVAGPEWQKNDPIYEVNLDAYGFAEGTAFREFEKHLPILKEMGVGILWIMPIHPRGEERAKEPRSPYAIRDYRAVNSVYGTLDDFKHLVARSHELDLHVLMDWVPNHSAWDNPYITEHPEFYLKNEASEIIQAKDYSDVAQLDFGTPENWNQALWNQMRDDMAFWIRECDIDGFRCDAAGQQANVPIEFWQWLRPQLDDIRPIFMLGEGDEGRLHPAFDMTYSWNLTPTLWEICAGRAPASAIDDILRTEVENFPQGSQRMRLVDNHDWHPQENWGVENGGPADPKGEALEVGPLMVLCTTLPGKPLIYNGQEMAHNHGNPPQQAEQRRESPLWDFYCRLLSLYRGQAAIHEGSFAKIVTDCDDKVYAFMRQFKTEQGIERVLVVLNLTPNEQSATLDNTSVPGEYCDWFGNQMTYLEAKPTLKLLPWGYQVYVGQISSEKAQ